MKSGANKISMVSSVDRLKAWFLRHGGRIHQSLIITHDETVGYYLRLRPACELPKIFTKDLVFCPMKLSLSVRNVDDPGSCWPEQFLARFSDAPEVTTRFLLMRQYRLGEDSFWWPYIDMLPKPEHDLNIEPPFDTPLWFDEDDLVWLEGTNLGAARRLREEAWKEEFNEGMALLTAYSQWGGDLVQYEWYVYDYPGYRKVLSDIGLSTNGLPLS